MLRPAKVLIVDDSAIVRHLLSTGLANDPKIQVVGQAADAFIARDMLLRLEPDVITLDIEMPRVDGLSFLKRIMEHRPTPTIIVSSISQYGSAAPSRNASRLAAEPY
jgi:two-component system chemotaxis response regulator CheB